MPQGKMKNKVKLPSSVAAKKKGKGKAATTRANAPIKSKGDKNRQAKKMKQVLTKTVNEAAEAEIRALAFDSSQKAQKSTTGRKPGKKPK